MARTFALAVPVNPPSGRSPNVGSITTAYLVQFFEEGSMTATNGGADVIFPVNANPVHINRAIVQAVLSEAMRQGLTVDEVDVIYVPLDRG